MFYLPIVQCHPSAVCSLQLEILSLLLVHTFQLNLFKAMEHLFFLGAKLMLWAIKNDYWPCLSCWTISTSVIGIELALRVKCAIVFCKVLISGIWLRSFCRTLSSKHKTHYHLHQIRCDYHKEPSISDLLMWCWLLLIPQIRREWGRIIGHSSEMPVTSSCTSIRSIIVWSFMWSHLWSHNI